MNSSVRAAWLGVPILVVCASGTARAHDVVLADKQKQKFQRFAAASVEMKLPPNQESMAKLFDLLAGFSADDLRHLTHTDAFRDLPLKDRPSIERVLSAACFVQAYSRFLQRPYPIGWQLGSKHPKDWLKARRLLLHEPIDDGLAKVAIALSTDERWQVRLTAGKVAKALSLLGEPAQRMNAQGIALRVANDVHPRAVAEFAAESADFRDPVLIDALIGKLRDKRVIPGWKGMTVGGAIGSSISWHFETCAEMPDSRPHPRGASDEERAKHWQRIRGTWNFAFDPNGWRLRLDVRCALKKDWPRAVQAGKKKLWVRLKHYREYMREDSAVFGTQIELTEDREGKTPIIEIGNAQAEDGFLMQSLAGGNATSIVVRAYVLPDGSGNYRTWLRMWESKK